MSKHYIAVLIPEQSGGWTVFFPDLPGCVTQGDSVHEAIEMAADAAERWLAAVRDRDRQVPAPRSYEEIRADDAWARAYEVDWSTAVISLVKVNVAANDT